MEVTRLKHCLALFLSLCVIAPFAQAIDFSYCNKKTEYDVEVSKVEISPDPLARGQTANFNVSASTAGAISNGILKIEVSFFGFQIHSETHDLCKETPCPVSVGDFVISHSQDLPAYTPPGWYTLTMKMLDEKHRQLTCIDLEFEIGFASSVADV